MLSAKSASVGVALIFATSIPIREHYRSLIYGIGYVKYEDENGNEEEKGGGRRDAKYESLPCWSSLLLPDSSLFFSVNSAILLVSS
jgi:hypothetical protein